MLADAAMHSPWPNMTIDSKRQYGVGGGYGGYLGFPGQMGPSLPKQGKRAWWPIGHQSRPAGMSYDEAMRKNITWGEMSPVPTMNKPPIPDIHVRTTVRGVNDQYKRNEPLYLPAPPAKPPPPGADPEPILPRKEVVSAKRHSSIVSPAEQLYLPAPQDVEEIDLEEQMMRGHMNRLAGNPKRTFQPLGLFQLATMRGTYTNTGGTRDTNTGTIHPSEPGPPQPPPLQQFGAVSVPTPSATGGGGTGGGGDPGPSTGSDLGFVCGSLALGLLISLAA